MALCAAGCGDGRPSAPLVNSTFLGKSTNPPTTLPATGPTVARIATTTTAPTTQASAPLPPANPESIPVMLVPGQYQTIGGVVTAVNGNPIYANKVIRLLRGELAARAPEMSPAQFRKFATDEMKTQINRLERDEVIFGAADRFLEADDRQLAEYLTMQFRTRKIIDAGGSVELAQKKAAADGDSFEELIYDKYRWFMSQIYLNQKVMPRIQVTAEDMRKYYKANVGREFTEFDEVTFRLIKVDARRWGGKDKAAARAADIAAKTVSGDFADLARKMNDDARLARLGGEEVPVQKGAYRLEKVEAALWTTPVGKTTGVIDDSGNFYIAKVESRKEGKVLPFEDKTVQERAYKALKDPQFIRLTGEIEARLRKPENSWVRPEVMDAVIEMAMQGYGIWAKPAN